MYLLTVQDQLTKYLTLIPTVGVTGEEAAKKLVNKYIYVYGTPREIIMDNAKGLQSVFMKRILTLLKIKPIPISAGHPQSNGSLERAHSTIKEQSRLITQDEPEIWDEHVPQVQYIFNTMENQSIGMILLKASFNKDHHLIEPINTPEDLKKQALIYMKDRIEELQARLQQIRFNLEKSKRIHEEEVTARRKGPTTLYKIGDKILVKVLRKAALSNPWAGPYFIADINHSTNTIYYKHKNRILQSHINETQLFLD